MDKYGGKSYVLSQKFRTAFPDYANLDPREDIQLQSPRVKHAGLEHFVRWFKGEPLSPRKGQQSIEDVEEMLSAHAVGVELDCVPFLDFVMNNLMKILANARCIAVGQFLKGWLQEFPEDSRGRLLAIKYMAHGKPGDLETGADKSSYTKMLTELEDQGFVYQLTEALMKRTRHDDVPKAMQLARDPENCLHLISGLLENQSSGVRSNFCDPPWMSTKCKYHHHQVRGLPCDTTSPVAST